MRRSLCLIASASLLTLQSTAMARADLAQDWFYSTDKAERDAIILQVDASATENNQRRFEAGTIRFFSALEDLATELYAYGFKVPGEDILRPATPLIPPNPAPAELRYADLRALIERFETRVDEARAKFAAIDPAQPVAIEIDFNKANLMLGSSSSETALLRFSQILETIRGRSPTQQKPPAPITFRFDNADAIWLEGYSNVVLAQTDLILAHDFEDLFDNTFHVFFDQKDMLVPKALDRFGTDRKVAGLDTELVDLIALIHLLDLPVADPERRVNAMQHMREVIRLSRANFTAIMAETDNDREWLPGAHQPGEHPLTSLTVTKERMDGWMRTLDLFDAVLDGKKLIPHFRFTNAGFDLAAFMRSDAPFDLVSLATGQAAIPFMREGDIITRKEWDDVSTMLGRANALNFALWFN